MSTSNNQPLRITTVDPLPVVITRPRHDEIRRLYQRIPVPKTEETVSFFEKIALQAEAFIRAGSLVARWTPRLIHIIYLVIIMDWKAILKAVTTVLVMILVKKTGITPDVEILGVNLHDIVSFILIGIAGWFLPQLRSLAPQWLKNLFRWNKQDTPPPAHGV